MTRLHINKREYSAKADADMPLLWYLRDILNLTGTKFGCGMGLCGACTVLVDGKAARSCMVTISSVENKEVTTIEGISQRMNNRLQPVWIEEQVPQCGYCQTGQIMSALALLKTNPNPSNEEIEAAMSGNICRCGTYSRIKKAICSAIGEESRG
ncbi:MAG: (2Fe-2S)-binding protein [Calditrichia bacterium]